MRGVKEFLKDSRPAMIDYILVVSTPSTEGYTSNSASAADRHDRLNIVNALRGRFTTKPVLDRESIPILPHLLDIPRHFAIITSAVIRSSRDYLASQPSHGAEDNVLRDFCLKCFEVEEQALHRVSQLATRISTHRRSSVSGSWSQSPETPKSPSSPSLSSSGPRSSKKTKRPSTAPSPSDTDRSPRQMLFEPSHTSSLVSSPTSPISKSSRLLHLKSPSSDSMPYEIQTTIDTPVPKAVEEETKRRKGLFRGIWKR